MFGMREIMLRLLFAKKVFFKPSDYKKTILQMQLLFAEGFHWQQRN